MSDSKLTPKQEAVKALLKQGITPRRVASVLGISTQAVYQIKRRIEKKTKGIRREKRAG